MTLRSSSLGEGPAAGRSLPDAQSGHRRVRATWTRGAGGLEAFVCGSAGRGPGVASGVGCVRAQGRREAVAQAHRARARGSGRRRAEGREQRRGGLTSPGTAPSTPSRYSGTARAAAGRCWRRG